jgi:hypothetical protein
MPIVHLLAGALEFGLNERAFEPDCVPPEPVQDRV